MGRAISHLFATIGASAVIAAASVGSVAIVESQSSSAGSGAVGGSTETQTTPPPVPVTSMAVPSIKGPAPLPPEEQGVPG